MPMSSEAQHVLQESVSRLSAVSETLEPLYAMQAKLTVALLRNAAEAAIADATPRSVADLDFALNDVGALVRELPEDAAGEFDRAVSACREVVDALKSEVTLPAEVLASLHGLREKLTIRRTAIDRATYRDPGTEAPPLPNDPATLREEALQLRDGLQRAGFDTPALSRLIDSPATFYRGELSELVDELDVISGE
jgi:hypothetical protein